MCKEKEVEHCSNSWSGWWFAGSTCSPCGLLSSLVLTATHHLCKLAINKENWYQNYHDTVSTLMVIQTVVGGVVQKDEEVSFPGNNQVYSCL